MIGYKIAKHCDTRVIITLEIPADAQTNAYRSSITVPETAKYRTNKATVVAIEDASGTSYTTATSFGYDKKSLVYNIGEVIEEPSYDLDSERVCAAGIHYFRTRRVAELYELRNVENGLYQQWYENGQKLEEVTYDVGKLHGLYQRWYPNGQKFEESTYVDGMRQGLYQSWYDNGQKSEEAIYVNWKFHGLYQHWLENGQKSSEVTYVNGEYNGSYRWWTENGQACEGRYDP